MKMEYEVVTAKKESFEVKVLYRGIEGVVVVPRPVFDTKTLRTMAIATYGVAKQLDDVRVAAEDLFVEAWMRHLRSKLDYWYKWWISVAPKGSPFPLEVVARKFFPKCAMQGSNMKMRTELRASLL